MSRRDELACYQILIRFKDMDMSGGDNVDGPRWTGKYIDEDAKVNVVAATPELAKAAAVSEFYEHQHAKATNYTKLCDVHLTVHIGKPRE